VLVAINNGLEPMPAPLTVNIGANSNVPPRIKSLIEGQTLTNYRTGGAGLPISGGRALIQLPGKTAGIYTI